MRTRSLTVGNTRPQHRRRPAPGGAIQDLADEVLVRKSREAPHLLRSHDVVQLQRLMGNRAVAGHMAGSPVMAGVTVQRDDDIDPQLARGARSLAKAVDNLAGVFTEPEKMDNWAEMIRTSYSETDYEPANTAWGELAESAGQLVEAEKSKPMVPATKAMLKELRAVKRTKRKQKSAGKSYDRWLKFADLVRDTKAKKVFRGLVNSRLKATDRDLKLQSRKLEDRTKSSVSSFGEYSKGIAQEIAQSNAGRRYQESGRKVTDIMKSAEEDTTECDNLQILYKAVGTIRYDPRLGQS